MKNSDYIPKFYANAPQPPFFIRVLRWLGNLAATLGILIVIVVILGAYAEASRPSYARTPGSDDARMWGLIIAITMIFVGYPIYHTLASMAESLIAIRKKLDAGNNSVPPTDSESSPATTSLPIAEK